MMLGERPTFLNVFEARKRIGSHIARTPLHHYPRLDKLIGAEVYVKHENHQLLGAFKIRGALNKEGEIVEAKMETIAGGLATKVGFEYTQEIMRDLMADFVLVSEDDLVQAVVLLIETTHNLAEHAGASPLAATIKIKDRLQDKKVALVMSGGNISRDQIKHALYQL